MSASQPGGQGREGAQWEDENGWGRGAIKPEREADREASRGNGEGVRWREKGKRDILKQLEEK